MRNLFFANFATWRLCERCLGFLCLGLFTIPAFADLPGTAYIFPLGGPTGSKVAVRVGGYFLHESAPFRITGPHVTASPQIEQTEKIWFEGPLIYQPASQGQENYPADYRGEIGIDPVAAPGVRRWSVHTAQGVTAGLPFVIGRGPEVVEQEVDGEPIPTAVALPVTINGRVFPRQDIDIWTFEAQAGQTITCSVLAARLGSPLISRLEVRDPAGQVIAEDLGSRGGDAFLQFETKATGRHAMHIHDAEYGGLQHYVYRLLITAGPFVTSAFPLGGAPGENLTVTLQGANLSSLTTTVRLPGTSGEVFWWHPDGLACDELGIPLDVSPAVAVAESEPNATLEQPQLVTLPADSPQKGVAINGRIDSPGDVDHFSFDAKSGVPLRVSIRAAALLSPLDSVIAVFDAKGQIVAQADDANNSPDAALTFTPAAEGRYIVAIKDRLSSRGGPDFAYRLHIAQGEEKPAVPFALKLPSDVLNIDRGGQAALKVDVQRFGFNETIELNCEGLPAGVTVTGTSIAQGGNQANLTFKAEATAKSGLQYVKIVGVAKKDGQEFRSVAALPPQPSEALRDSVALSVNVPTPFKIYGRFESKFSPRGSVYVRHYFIDRKGFDGPLEISLADRQNRHLQGVRGPKLVIPASVNEFDYPLTLPPRMELGRTSRTCLMAVGVVTLEDGSPAKVSYSSQEQNDQIIVITAPERMQIVLSNENFLVEPGREYTVTVGLQRDMQLTQPTTIELVCPPHLPIAMAEPLTLAATETSGHFKIRLSDTPLPAINMPITIRATTLDERGLAVVSDAALELITPQ